MPSSHVYMEVAASGRMVLSMRCRLRYCFLGFVTRFYTWCFSLLVFLFLSLPGHSQPGGEVGLIGGGGYYLGDFNPSRHFRSTQSYFGGFYRYNLNDRFAVRLNVGFSRVALKDVSLLSNGSVVFPTEFRSSVRDASLLAEFNFRSFMVHKVEHSSWWSPYVFAGVGFLGNGESGVVNVPLGVGMKFNVYRQVSCGLEWSTRKLFSDGFDGLSDPWGTGETNFLFNKDWFFVVGLTVSYRFPTDPACHFR